MHIKEKIINCLLISIGFIIISLPLWSLFPAESWHDNQRFGQVVIFCLSFFIYFFGKYKNIKILKIDELIVVLLIFFIAFFSSIFSRKPIWAFAELSVFLCSFFLAMVMTFIRGEAEEKFDTKLMDVILLISSLIVFKFILNYLYFENNWTGSLNLWALIPGFDNPRFFGQFATLIAPLLCVIVIGGNRGKLSVFVALLWYLMIFVSGTRGTWFSLLIMSFLLFFFNNFGKKLAMVQLGFMFFGFFLYLFLFRFIQIFLDFEILNSIEDRVSTSLSAREIIWSKAIQMIMERPYLGFGPMHFSDEALPEAAHPHQSILQFASECGIPFSLILLVLIVWMASGIIRKKSIKNENYEFNKLNYLYVGLILAVGASLLQSLLDGVFVMPNTEIWFTIYAAWLFGVYRGYSRCNCKNNVFKENLVTLIFFVSAIFLVVFVIENKPKTWSEYSDEKKNLEKRFLPRFWVQGIINENY